MIINYIAMTIQQRHSTRVLAREELVSGKVRIKQLANSLQLQFREEYFNFANHANFSIQAAQLASPRFGRIIEAGPPRQLQFGVKFSERRSE
ncbi:MAG TPA: hypothetical protein VFJ27_10570 [Terriglobia bacterium]|nr:hypothetical protein [Terriglobia bacterium]